MKQLLKFFLLPGIACLLTLQASALTVDFAFTSGCLTSPTTLTSLSTPADSILALLWDLDADGLFNDGSGLTVITTFATIGNHPVGLQVVAKNGDIRALYKDVPVSGVQAAFSFNSGCVGEPVQFTDLSTSFADTIFLRTWNFGDGSPSVIAQNPEHTFTQTGTFTVTLWLVSELGCQDSLISEIVLQPPPVFDLLFTGDTATFNNDTILAEVTGTYDSALWNGTITSSIFMITKPGTYEVSVYREGCFTSEVFTIRDHPEIKAGIMTLFTPNGDGFNDFWVIKGMDSMGACSVRVFDCWGNLVYENSDYKNTWDGRSDNGELPSGPYYYVMQFAVGEIYKGTVNILR